MNEVNMPSTRKIDLIDMPEITDFSKGRKNPFAEKIKNEGYTIRVHYSPEDLAKISGDDFLVLDLEEKAAFDKYTSENNFL